MRARHVAFIKARLASSWGKEQIRKNLEAVSERWLDTKVADLFDAASLMRVAAAFTDEKTLTGTVRPLVKAAVLLEMARLREDPEKLKTYVSDEARDLIHEMLARPNLVPAEFVRHMMGHQAFEEISRDVLDDALKDFSDKVDPFKAEWGIPSLLKLGGPIAFGLGAFSKGVDTIRVEFQKRLEPERKKFLQVAARKALNMVADFMIKRSDEPQFIALRKELFAWLLEQPVSELVAPANEEVTDLGERIGHALTRHVSALEGTQRRRRATIDMLLAAHGQQPLREALTIYGATITPDYDALVEVAWPFVKSALETPEVEEFFDSLVGDFYSEEP